MLHRTSIVALSALVLLGSISSTHAITVGAGTGIPLETVDTPGIQPRTNVDQTYFATLPVGTYRVDSFSYAAGQSGSVTPFVALPIGADNYQVLALGDQVNVAGAGTQTVAFGSAPRYFSVTTAGTQVVAGITNPPGSQNPVFLDNNTVLALTDHDNTPAILTGPGSAVNAFSHPNLARTYAYAIDFAAASPDRVGAGVGIQHETVDTANGPRTNVDQSFTRVLQPGIYVVSNWEYAAGQAGSVVPFVAASNGVDSYQTLAVGQQVDILAPIVNTSTFGKSNTIVITAPTTVYGGITNPAGSNNPIYLDNNTTTSTDHDGSALSPVTNPGQTVNGFSNPNLNRTYAFAINYGLREPAQRLGPDITIPHEALDTANGPRMNIDDSFTLTLGPGTYDITDFSFSSGQAGQVTPFLAVLNGGQYEVIAVGDTQTVGAGNHNVTVDFGGNGFFTLLSSTTVYAGITNPAGSNNPVYTDLNSGFTTDHDGSPVTLTGVGQVIPLATISNQNLARSYAFSIGVQAQAVPEPATLSLLALAGVGLLGRRRRA